MEYFGINLNRCFRNKIQTNSICNGVEETMKMLLLRRSVLSYSIKVNLLFQVTEIVFAVISVLLTRELMKHCRKSL